MIKGVRGDVHYSLLCFTIALRYSLSLGSSRPSRLPSVPSHAITHSDRIRLINRSWAEGGSVSCWERHPHQGINPEPSLCQNYLFSTVGPTRFLHISADFCSHHRNPR